MLSYFYNCTQMKGKAKLQIQTFKNKVKTKNNIKLKAQMTYQQLLQKIPTFTSRSYILEILNGDGSLFGVLNAENFKDFLSNYKGQKLNINTEFKEKENGFPSNNQMPEKNAKQTNQLQKNIIDKRDQLQTQQPAQTLNLIEAISNLYEQSEFLQQFKRKHPNSSIKQSQEYLPKCSQCSQKFLTVYYRCLICQPVIILCENCEEKEDIIGIKCHPFRQHPFAKIKRWTQAIKTVNIVLQEEQLMGRMTKDHNKDQIISKQGQIRQLNNLISREISQRIHQILPQIRNLNEWKTHSTIKREQAIK